MANSLHKESGLGDVRVGTVPRAYDKYLGRYPWLEALVLSAGGGLAGYYGGGLLANKVFRRMGGTPEEQEEMGRRGEFDRVKLISSIFGAATGLAYATHKHSDVGSGAGGFAKSMLTPDYWQKNPEAYQRLMAKREEKKRLPAKPYRHIPYFSGRMTKTSALAKEALDYLLDQGSIGDAFLGERVPISYSADLIRTDPFLSLPQRDFAAGIIEDSERNDSGLTSGRKIARSAIQAGVGLAAGYLFGQTMSSILSLPPPVTKKLSVIGGIAGAIVNTGIFEQKR